MSVPLAFLLMAVTCNGFFLPSKQVGTSYLKSNVWNRSPLRNAPTDAVTTDESTSSVYAFVNKDLRPYAMKLHTPRQAPKEGKSKGPEAFETEEKATEAMKAAQAAEPLVPRIVWQPARINYVQYLVDSLLVYETLESLSVQYPELEPFKATGLERGAALREDLAFLAQTYSMTIPPPGPHGPGYSAHLRELAASDMPKFMCHYYNHMFAHTAGGRMIGKHFANLLLDGTTLKFYQWEGDVKEMGVATVQKIDEMAATWTAEQKEACLQETGMSFRYSGALMAYLNPPSVEMNNMITYA